MSIYPDSMLEGSVKANYRGWIIWMKDLGDDDTLIWYSIGSITVCHGVDTLVWRINEFMKDIDDNIRILNDETVPEELKGALRQAM